MVVKLSSSISPRESVFESSVISYGSKTCIPPYPITPGFESSVISYGSKTKALSRKQVLVFESSVISYGSKTCSSPYRWCY